MISPRTGLDSRIKRLGVLLAGRRPGARSHRMVLPAEDLPRRIPAGEARRRAAVLLGIESAGRRGSVRIPLIIRPSSMKRHADQIGLPGGAIDPGENPVSCALREAQEEIGLLEAGVVVLGRLTRISIPVSGYEVVPIVGRIARGTRYRPRAEEVRGILFADPDALLKSGPCLSVERSRGGKTLRFAAYPVGEHRVWGATAMILAEFLNLWRRTGHP